MSCSWYSCRVAPWIPVWNLGSAMMLGAMCAPPLTSRLFVLLASFLLSSALALSLFPLISFFFDFHTDELFHLLVLPILLFLQLSSAPLCSPAFFLFSLSLSNLSSCSVSPLLLLSHFSSQSPPPSASFHLDTTTHVSESQSILKNRRNKKRENFEKWRSLGLNY